MAAATVTPQPTLSTTKLKYVADVAFLAVDDTAGTVTHNLAVLNPIIIPICSAMGTVAAAPIVAIVNANSFTVTKNTTAANTTATWRFIVLRPHSLVAKPV